MVYSIPPKLKEISERKLEELVQEYLSVEDPKIIDVKAYNFIDFYRQNRQDNFYEILTRKYLADTERVEYGIEKWLKDIQDYIPKEQKKSE